MASHTVQPSVWRRRNIRRLRKLPAAPSGVADVSVLTGADATLLTVGAFASVPIGLLVIAVRGGGLAAVVIAFITLVLITAGLGGVILRAVTEPSLDDQ